MMLEAQHLPHKGRTFLPDWQARTCRPCECQGTGWSREMAPAPEPGLSPIPTTCEGCNGDGCLPVCGCLAFWPMGSFDLQEEATWERGNCNWQQCVCGCHNKNGSHAACCQGACNIKEAKHD